MLLRVMSSPSMGTARYIGHLDFWIGTHGNNPDRVLAALSQFGFGSLGMERKDLTTPNQVIQMKSPLARIDLLTSIDDVDSFDCYERRRVVQVDGIALGFIALDDFKINKKSVARYRDLADLEALDAIKMLKSTAAANSQPKNKTEP